MPAALVFKDCLWRPMPSAIPALVSWVNARQDGGSFGGLPRAIQGRMLCTTSVLLTSNSACIALIRTQTIGEQPSSQIPFVS